MCEVPNSMNRIEDPEPAPVLADEVVDKKYEDLKLKHAQLLNEYRQLFHKVNIENKLSRNQPCICGSGKKWKNCCLSIHEQDTIMLEDLVKAFNEVKEQLRNKQDN